MDQGIHEAVSRPRCSAVGTAVALAAGLVEGAANSLPMDCNTGRNSVSVPELWLCFAVPLSFSSFEDEGRCLGHLHSFRASRSQVKQGDGTWRANPPFFFRQRAERSGTSPLRHLLQLEGCLQRTARRRAPCGGCQNISRLPQATEYQEYLAGTETSSPARTPTKTSSTTLSCLELMVS